MKIWIKLLIGSLIGLAAGFFIPVQAQGLFDSVSSLLVGIGRYALFPFIFFSLGIGTSELRQEKRLLRVYFSVFKYLVLAAGLLIIIGTLSVLVFPPERIPITIEADRAFTPVSVIDGLKTVFPRNLFAVFFGSGDFLLPVVVLAFLLGLNMDFDRQLTRPVVQLFDSLSRIFYHLNSLIVELFAIALIAIAAGRISHLSHAELDQYISLGIVSKHGKESLGVPRMVGSAVYPLFAILGRAGTAMVATVSFILILRSYSSLEITFLQTLWVMFFSFVVSFILGAMPGNGAFFAIFMLCSLYAKGLQEGYLILKTIAPLLVSFGAFIDVLTSAFVSLLIAREENVWTEVEAENFI